MRVVGWGPSNRPVPCVPDYVVAIDGSVHGRNGPYLNDAFTRPCPQLEVSDGSWMGVRHDGKSEVFLTSGEDAWRSRTAMEAVQSTTAPGPDPEKTITTLRAAADLVGLDLPDLVERLEAARSGPAEGLSEVFGRTGGRK